MFYSFEQCASQKSGTSDDILRFRKELYTGFSYVYELFPQQFLDNTTVQMRAVQSNLGANTFFTINGTPSNLKNRSVEFKLNATNTPVEIELFCEEETEV